MKRKIVALLTVGIMAVGLLAGCSSGKQEGYVIGISQFAEHGSLDNCREGFLQGLAAEGIVEGDNLTILYNNAQTDMGTAGIIADNYVSQKVDLICAIATPSAMTAYNATLNTDIPVIYTAVTSPLEAGLVDAEGNNTGNITGTSDVLAITDQLQMIRNVLPEAKKIGILYTTSEANSVSAIAAYEAVAGEYGFEIVSTGVSTLADVPLAAANLVEQVDCITNLTDNTVVSALPSVLEAANSRNIPVFGSEVEQVKAGCVATMGLEYKELGEITGKMAAQVLKGEKSASDIPFESIEKPYLYVNTAAAEKIGLTLPEGFTAEAFQVFDTVQ